MESDEEYSYYSEEEEEEESEYESEYESEEEEEVRNDNNVMLNPVILETFFSVCPTQILKDCRLVCKLWFHMSLRRCREELVYSVVCRDSFKQNNNALVNKKTNLLDELLQKSPSESSLVQSITQHPIRNWRFHFLFRRLDDYDKIPDFFRDFGPSIKYIHLDHLHVCSKSLQALKKILYGQLPNLEHLVFSHFLYSYDREQGAGRNKDEDGMREGCLEQTKLKTLEVNVGVKLGPGDGYFPIAWPELFQHFPFIQSLTLQHFGAQENISNVLQAIKSVKRTSQCKKAKLNLKVLDIWNFHNHPPFEIPAGTCRLLQQMQLPLTTLTLDLGQWTKEASFKNILESYSGSLTTLKIKRSPTSPPFENFPFGIALNKLEVLECEGSITQNLQFLRHTPNLRRLQMTHQFLSLDIRDEHLEDIEMTSLEELLLIGCTTLTMDQLNLLIMCMPNVRKVRMLLTKDTFRLVLQRWKYVTDICTIPSSIDDVMVLV